jgi:hypothetical protein
MNDNNQQQQNQTQMPPVVPTVPAAPASPFGTSSVPYANIPQVPKQDLANVVYGPANPEGQPIKIESPAEAVKAPENSQETQKLQENKLEKVHPAELKEFKQYYPQNKQPAAPASQTPPAQTSTPARPAPKFFGYMVSPQIANNYSVISTLKGKGDPKKSRTWIYMLLDRILKRETYIKDNKV